jgi:BirA family transcriptional regulator, biotin operon repressor / biotin---[acetyl-CoA-carboxylase] ligase
MEEATARFHGEPILVTAARQLRGRGRSGRKWVHAERAVAASLSLALDWEPHRLGVVPLVAGLAAADSFPVALKWPNDLMRDRAKVGGILVEFADGVVVVGIGVNLFWPRPVAGAGALFTEDPGAEAAVHLAEDWASRLVSRLSAGPDDWGRSAYEGLCTTIGAEIEWDPGGAGSCRGVDERGRLVVETPDGLVLLDSGEVRHVRAV